MSKTIKCPMCGTQYNADYSYPNELLNQLATLELKPRQINLTIDITEICECPECGMAWKKDLEIPDYDDLEAYIYSREPYLHAIENAEFQWHQFWLHDNEAYRFFKAAFIAEEVFNKSRLAFEYFLVSANIIDLRSTKRGNNLRKFIMTRIPYTKAFPEYLFQVINVYRRAGKFDKSLSLCHKCDIPDIGEYKILLAFQIEKNYAKDSGKYKYDDVMKWLRKKRMMNSSGRSLR